MTTETTRMRKYYDKLAGEPSRLGKESLLEEYGHDAVFIRTLQFLYNPLITTGISEKKLLKITAEEDTNESSISTLTELLEHLEQNSTGRDADLKVITNFISLNKFDDEDSTFLKKLVSKTLKVGITAKTINKVFTGEKEGEPFLYEFSPMLAADFAKRAEKITGEFFVTQKLDGIRCLAFKGTNDEGTISVSLFARSGKEIIGQNFIKQEIADNENIPADTIIDGELLVRDSENLSVGEMFRSTQKIVRSESSDNDGDILFWVFDTIPTSEFKTGKSSLVYSERREQIEEWISASEETESAVRVLPVLYRGNDKVMVTDAAQEAEDAGFEGVMVNTSDGLYQNKRTDALQKVKSFKTADLLCTKVLEGTGRHVSRLGAVAVEYKDNIVHVGSGFDDVERDAFFADEDQIVGKVIEVKYFEETTDSTTGKPSLRFPVFVGIRDDKTEDDINYG